MKALSRYIDPRFGRTAWISATFALFCIAACAGAPTDFADKNSPIEYMQLVVLFIGMGVAFSARQERSLWRFAGFLLLFFALREVNYGRTLPFFAEEGNPNKFPRWKDIPYGWVAHVAVGVYWTALALYFICKKLWVNILLILKNTRMPLWETLFLVAALAMVHVQERFLHNNIGEEFAELSFYVTLILLICRYSRGLLRPAGR